MSIPRESPSHERYNPPVVKTTCVTPGPIARAEFRQWLAESANRSTDAIDEALWHGGIWMARERIRDWPDRIAGDTRVDVFTFSREPEVAEVNAGDVLFDDEAWVAVNKPAWLPVQGTRASQRISLETQLRELIGCAWLSPVHRLDRQTSGVNLFAKSPVAFEAAARQFRKRTVNKRYLARVETPPAEQRFTVTGYMRRSAHPSHTFFEFSATELEGGRFSETEFVVRDDGVVQAVPHTGRTHQIRVHLASVGSPVAGDTLYGAPWRERAPERVLLHSLELHLSHGGKALHIQAPMSPDFLRYPC